MLSINIIYNTTSHHHVQYLSYITFQHYVQYSILSIRCNASPNHYYYYYYRCITLQLHQIVFAV